MNPYNYSNKEEKLKDIKKGHKIAAALYLVTHHLSDSDPLKIALRTHAINLISFGLEEKVAGLASHVQSLLETAVLAGLISEKNASIIKLELRHHVIDQTTEADSVATLFTPVFEQAATKSIGHHSPKNMSLNTVPKNTPSSENKSKRQETILSFIRERKSAGIKDIASLFSDMSEKTVQRELSALVSIGKITKRGEKRWSVYMSV
jgi:hypothetical protein